MIPWRGERLFSPIFLPGEFQGQRGLAGHSPWDHKESDMTEWLPLSFYFQRLVMLIIFSSAYWPLKRCLFTSSIQFLIELFYILTEIFVFVFSYLCILGRLILSLLFHLQTFSVFMWVVFPCLWFPSQNNIF